MAGVSKLLGATAHVQHFAHWGYPDWFRLVVGAVETISAVLLIVPRSVALGGDRHHHVRRHLHASVPSRRRSLSLPFHGDAPDFRYSGCVREKPSDGFFGVTGYVMVALS